MGKINAHNYEAFLLDYLEGNLGEEDIAELQAFALNHPELDIDLELENLPVVRKEDLDFDLKDHLKKSESDFLNEEVLNYLEGLLPEEERKLFEAKLLSNNELAKKLAFFKKAVLKPDHAEIFGDRAELYKTREDLLLNNRVIAYFENELNAEDKQAFEAELKTNNSLQAELDLVSKTRAVADVQVVYPNKKELKKEARIIALFNFRTVASVAAAILLLIGLTLVVNYYGPHKPLAAEEVLAKVKESVPTDSVVKAPIVLPVPETNLAEQQVKHQGSGINKGTASQLHPQAVIEKLVKSEEPVNLVQANDQENHAPGVKEETFNGSKDALANNNQSSENQQLINKDSLLSPSYSDTKQVVVMTEEEDDMDNSATAKKGFWERAVKLAHRANHAGIKAVDGEEASGQRFSLSFNSFSVEKH